MVRGVMVRGSICGWKRHAVVSRFAPSCKMVANGAFRFQKIGLSNIPQVRR